MARPRKFDEAQVLESAKELFWRKGFAATTLDDISVATGLGKGSLYGAFGDKHALFERVFDEYCTDAIKHVHDELQRSTAPAYERLRAYIRSEAAACAASDRGCLLARGTAELAAADPVVAERAKAAFDRYELLLVETITQAQREGDIDARADATAFGALLLTVLRGLEPLRQGGKSEAFLRSAAETALASLPPGPSRAEL